MNEEEALAALSALANRRRLQVLRRLVQAGPKGMVAGDISKAIGVTPSQASFHLSALAEGGLVNAERNARHITYRTRFETFAALVAFIMEDCCGDSAENDACPCGPQPSG